jgi:transposase InsO family protein
MVLRVSGLVDLRLALLREVDRGASVSEVCDRYGISRDTYYRYRARLRDQGVAGLFDQSRRPDRSPTQLPGWVEDELMLVRKEHPEWGARKIRAAVARSGALGDVGVPAASTVHALLVRRGEVSPGERRARPVWQRFRAAAPNLLWQIDAYQCELDGGGTAWVIDILDDHSRFLLASLAAPAPTCAAAWRAFRAAVADGGLPGRLLSDNGLCFTGRLHNREVSFERQLAAAGVPFSHSRAYHPQTCGKNERSHRTSQQWQKHQPPPATIADLQRRQDRFRAHYNQERPHEALGMAVPADIYRPGTPVTLPSIDIEPADHYPSGCLKRAVRGNGTLSYSGLSLDLGERWADVTVGLVRDHARLHVYYGQAKIASFLIGDRPDPQPRGRKPRPNP